MIIKLNNEVVRIADEEICLEELLSYKNISLSGTAIARNGKLVPRNRWKDEKLCDNDDLVVISAAFGG